MTKEELGEATGYKLRMVYLKWYYRLFKPMPGTDRWEEVGQFGPFEWGDMLHEVKVELDTLGLFDIERELGSRGK